MSDLKPSSSESVQAEANEQQPTEAVSTEQASKESRKVSLAEAAKQLLAKKKEMQAQNKGGHNGPQNAGNNITKEAPRKKQQNQRRRMGV
jgi:hypothetical protein